MAAYEGRVEIVRIGAVIATGQAHLESEPAEGTGASGWHGTVELSPDSRDHEWRVEVMTIRLLPSGGEAQALISPMSAGIRRLVVTSAPGSQPFWE